MNCYLSKKRKYLQLTTMGLHLLLLSWDFTDITKTTLIILQCVLCIFSVSDHNINGLQPEIKRFILYKKHSNCWKNIKKLSECHRVSLVQVDRGEAIDVVHLLQCDVQFGAQYRGRAGLLRRCQNLLCLLSDGVQVFF